MAGRQFRFPSGFPPAPLPRFLSQTGRMRYGRIRCRVGGLSCGFGTGVWRPRPAGGSGKSRIRLPFSPIGTRSAPDLPSSGIPRRWIPAGLGDRLPGHTAPPHTMSQTGMTASRTTIRNALLYLPRITTTFTRPDGRRVHVRNTALPNADPAAIDHAIQIAPRLRTCARSSSEMVSVGVAQQSRKIPKIKVCSATRFFKILNAMTFFHKMLQMDWERGRGEHAHDRVRQYFPEGTDFRRDQLRCEQ